MTLSDGLKEPTFARLDEIRPFVYDPGIEGVLPLVFDDPEAGVLVYALQGRRIVLQERLTFWADTKRPKAAKEFFLEGVALLQRAAQAAEARGVSRHGSINPWTLAARCDDASGDRLAVLGYGLTPFEDAPRAAVSGSKSKRGPTKEQCNTWRTARYLQPEQFGLTEKGPALTSELYSLALIAAEIATGKPVFSDQQVHEKGIEKAMLELRAEDLQSDMDPVLASVLGKMLAASPSHRPTTVRAVKSLDKITGGTFAMWMAAKGHTYNSGAPHPLDSRAFDSRTLDSRGLDSRAEDTLANALMPVSVPSAPPRELALDVHPETPPEGSPETPEATPAPPALQEPVAETDPELASDAPTDEAPQPALVADPSPRNSTSDPSPGPVPEPVPELNPEPVAHRVLSGGAFGGASGGGSAGRSAPGLPHIPSSTPASQGIGRNREPATTASERPSVERIAPTAPAPKRKGKTHPPVEDDAAAEVRTAALSLLEHGLNPTGPWAAPEGWPTALGDALLANDPTDAIAAVLHHADPLPRPDAALLCACAFLTVGEPERAAVTLNDAAASTARPGPWRRALRLLLQARIHVARAAWREARAAFLLAEDAIRTAPDADLWDATIQAYKTELEIIERPTEADRAMSELLDRLGERTPLHQQWTRLRRAELRLGVGLPVTEEDLANDDACCPSGPLVAWAHALRGIVAALSGQQRAAERELVVAQHRSPSPAVRRKALVWNVLHMVVTGAKYERVLQELDEIDALAPHDPLAGAVRAMIQRVQPPRPGRDAQEVVLLYRALEAWRARARLASEAVAAELPDLPLSHDRDASIAIRLILAVPRPTPVPSSNAPQPLAQSTHNLA